MVGSDERYSMEAFKAACVASLPEAQEPPRNATREKGWTKRIVKEVEAEQARKRKGAAMKN